MMDVRVESNSRACSNAVEEALAYAVGKVAALLELEAKRELQALVYSTPESPDYQRTGNLMNSLRQHQTGRLEAEVYADAEYAAIVHEGTSRVTPRPFLDNARRKVEGNVAAIADEALRMKGLR